MPEPKKRKRIISMTLDEDTIAYLDAKKLTLVPGIQLSRSAVVRWLVAQRKDE